MQGNDIELKEAKAEIEVLAEVIKEQEETIAEKSDLVNGLLAEVDDALTVKEEAEARAIKAEAKVEDLEDLVDTLRQNMVELLKQRGGGPAEKQADEVEEATDPPASLDEVIDRMIGAADGAEGVVLTEQAVKAARMMTNYKRWERMLDAVQAVIDCAEAYHSGQLAGSFLEFFEDRGYKYRHTNPAAYAYPGYEIDHKDKRVVMEPHLAVDGNSTRERVLRIHWYIDEDERTFVIGHVGKHLPDGTT
jgi:hypothetical protein